MKPKVYVRVLPERSRAIVLSWKKGKVTVKPITAGTTFSVPEDRVEREPTLEKP